MDDEKFEKIKEIIETTVHANTAQIACLQDAFCVLVSLSRVDIPEILSRIQKLNRTEENEIFRQMYLATRDSLVSDLIKMSFSKHIGQ